MESSVKLLPCEPWHKKISETPLALALCTLLACGQNSASDPDAGVSSKQDAGPVCGNGIVEAGEQCDQGADNSDAWSQAAHCNASCTTIAPYCGDGVTDEGAGETCDEGENNSDTWALGSHCNASCTGLAPYCGDGVTDEGAGETCDEGENNSDTWAQGSHCNASCTGPAPYCGDGETDALDGEACDDGLQNSDAWAEQEHCNISCSGSAPLCDLAEDSSISLPHPGVPYPPENPHSHEKAVLGKILFWEQQMSSDDTVACGTCHQPSAGGSDGRSNQPLHPGPDGLDETSDDVRGSAGMVRCEMIAGVPTPKSDPVFADGLQVTGRHSPSYLDAMFAPSLFWDGRATSEFIDPDTQLVVIAAGGALESQALAPLLSPVEMACESWGFSDLYSKLSTVTPLALASNLPPDVANAICKYPSYPQLFEAAFGDTQINSQRIAFAIATYERSLVSDRTPYDRFVDPVAPDNTALTSAQQQGLVAYQAAACQDCHVLTAPNADAPHPFTNNDFHHLGFDDISVQANPDLGRQEFTGLASDRGKFKTSTLRNVGLREAAGLLHDGRGQTLDSVLAAYNITGVPPGAGSPTDPLIIPLGLTAQELADMADFLRKGLTDPRVQSETYPFDHPTLSN